MAKPGRKPKGDRHPMLVRVPKEHHALYAAAAKQAGMPLGDFLAVVLAERFDLDVPSYVDRDKNRNQRELPISA